MVEEAHRQHLRVAVHAVDKPSIQTAIDAGADSIEHGNGITDEQLKQMRDKGMSFDLAPTSYGHFFIEAFEGTTAEFLALRAERLETDERDRQRYNDLAQRIQNSGFVGGFEARDKQLYNSLVQRVLRSGVKFAVGTDMAGTTQEKHVGKPPSQDFPRCTKLECPRLT